MCYLTKQYYRAKYFWTLQLVTARRRLRHDIMSVDNVFRNEDKEGNMEYIFPRKVDMLGHSTSRGQQSKSMLYMGEGWQRTLYQTFTM